MKPGRKHLFSKISGLFFILFWLAGCKSSGEVGIPFKNGTECLGENARPAAADVVFVSPDGRDDNPGDSSEAPYQTLAYALCNTRPGQTVKVMPGTYHESVLLGAFGRADSPILIQGVPDGDALPVLDGEGMRMMGIGLVETVNFMVENLEFRGYTDEGLYVLTSEQIVVRDNRFIGNGRASLDPDHEGEGFGVNLVGVKDGLIEGNEASENGPTPKRVAQGILGTGINTFELQDSIIRDNYAHHNTGGGMLVEEGIRVLVENNRLEANELDAGGDYWDGGLWLDGGHDVTVSNNQITGNHGPGLEISDEEARYPDSSYGYLIAGNQITGNEFGVYLWNYGICPRPADTAVAFTGNTIEQNIQNDFWCEEWGCDVGQACD